MKVLYFIIVEQLEYENYAKVIDKTKILVLPQKYLDDYDTCDNLGDTKSKGPGAARNFAWDHSIDLGAKRHWVMDDNISTFFRLNRNRFAVVNEGVLFRCMEDFVDRYKNISMAGPNYFMFVKRDDSLPPYVLNTRIYSCNLIENNCPYRWRGRYNEDTILSLDMLKAGFCTVQFNAFLQFKAPTQTVKGGNSKEFYDDEGTLPKSKMLEDVHPDVARVAFKFGRWHHHVDYTPFKGNMLIKKDGLVVKPGVNNYGMKLKNITKQR